MYGCTELRKVRAASLNQIAEILDDDDAWKTFASLIPKDLSSLRFAPKYNSDHIRSIEKHAQENKVKCAIVLFDEWGSSGINRPTLHTLQSILIKADMFRAADALAKLINENPPPRPTHGPGAHINAPSAVNSGSSEQDTDELNENHINSDGTYIFRRIPTKPIGSATTVESTEENPPPRPTHGPGAHIDAPSAVNSGSSEQDTDELNENDIDNTTVESTEGPMIFNPNNYNVPNFNYIDHHCTKMISTKNRENESNQ